MSTFYNEIPAGQFRSCYHQHKRDPQSEYIVRLEPDKFALIMRLSEPRDDLFKQVVIHFDQWDKDLFNEGLKSFLSIVLLLFN